MELEFKKKKILVEKELYIRLKSISIWLQQGDGNTKYFHNFCRHRISNNTIWQLENGAGQMICGFDDLVEVISTHFSGLYKEDAGATLRNMMDLVAFYPNTTSVDHDELMFEHVSMEDLKAAISSMKADKSLGLDGFPIEFYVGFLDILESDILAVEEESRVQGRILGTLITPF